MSQTPMRLAISRRAFLKSAASLGLAVAGGRLLSPMPAVASAAVEQAPLGVALPVLRTRAGSDADASFQQLGERVGDAMQRLKVPGVAVGVLHQGEQRLGGFGVTSVEHPLPVDADTLFPISSMTKTYTAAAAMRLIEQGRLELDAPVRAYLPGLRLADEQVAATVTLRNLLTHTSGLGDNIFADTGPGDDAVTRYVEEMVDIPQLAPRGFAFSYCNAGFILVGRLIEVVTGKTYEAALKELLLDPLGLSQSFLFADDAITRPVAVGHVDSGQGPTVARPWRFPRAVAPAGALVSSVGDVLRYGRFHLGDGTAADGARVLSAESLALVKQPNGPGGTILVYDLDAFGLPWMLWEVGGVRVVLHGGTGIGQQATLMMVPEQHFAIAVLTNSSAGSRLYREVTEWALGHYLGLALPTPSPIGRSADELASYAGRYVSADAGGVEVSVREGGLLLEFIQSGALVGAGLPPIPLVFYAPDRVMRADGPPGSIKSDFVRDAEGGIGWLRFGGRLFPRLASDARLEPWMAFQPEQVLWL